MSLGRRPRHWIPFSIGAQGGGSSSEENGLTLGRPMFSSSAKMSDYQHETGAAPPTVYLLPEMAQTMR